MEVGDVVMLKSGSPPMTVVNVNEDAAEVIWYQQPGDIKSAVFPIVALRDAVTPNDGPKMKLN